MKKTIHNDILGLAFKDYYQGKTDAKISIHSPDFDEDSIDVSHYFRSYELMPEIEKHALRYCQGKLLDIGAGAGSHALYLQELGFDVTGMDISAGACEIMKERGLKKVLNENIFSYRNEKFDMLFMMMNGIGIVENLEGLKKYLEMLPSILNPGGRMVFDSTNLIYLFTEDDGSVWIDLNKKYYGEVSFRMEYKSHISPEFNWLYVDFDVITSFCNDLGYKIKMLNEGVNFHYLAEISL